MGSSLRDNYRRNALNVTKAFDTVNKMKLWSLLDRYGCPSRFISVIRQFHEGMVGSDGMESDGFQVTNGVK